MKFADGSRKQFDRSMRIARDFRNYDGRIVEQQWIAIKLTFEVTADVIAVLFGREIIPVTVASGIAEHVAAACLPVEVRPYSVAVAASLLHRLAADLCNQSQYRRLFSYVPYVFAYLTPSKLAQDSPRFGRPVQAGEKEKEDRASHVLSASSLEKSQFGISATHTACCNLHCS